MNAIVPLPVKEIALHEAKRHFAASDIFSGTDHPLFNNSAVDGYAFNFNANVKEWKVVTSIAAGEIFQRELCAGECARIFTGAMLPPGADTVVMQEFVKRIGDRITHSDYRLSRGRNVRLKSEQIKAGALALRKGEFISPVAAGLLASIGTSKVMVHEWPYVSIVITGDEFADEDPPIGKIFSSNDIMLASALRSAGIDPVVLRSSDDPDQLRKTLRHALSVSDMIITTGGVSVGEHDHVRQVLEEIGVELLFHKVAQKPGKPMLFGTSQQKLIFGLPGNPRAVMILCWEYVLPTIHKLMGAEDPGPRTALLPIGCSVDLKGERSEFRAARITNGRVELLRDEGSHMLSSLINADALIYFPANSDHVEAGSLVEVHLLPDR